MEPLTWLVVARHGAGAVIAVIGLVLVAGGGVGMLRFPDVYTRTHAALAADGAGAALTALGLAVMADDGALSARLLLLALLALAVTPFTAHAVASSAHAGGLAPLSGAYVAPRPGGKPAIAP